MQKSNKDKKKEKLNELVQGQNFVECHSKVPQVNSSSKVREYQTFGKRDQKKQGHGPDDLIGL
jgi:hypothetical protein